MLNIVFLDKDTVGEVPELSNLTKYGNVHFYGHTNPDQIVERCKLAEIVITNKVQITKYIMQQMPNLRLICVAATGINNIDKEYARAQNIVVLNVKSYSTDSVAQVTFALIFKLLNDLTYFNNYVISGAYGNSTNFTHLDKSFSELKGMKFGIVGLGEIGKKVAQIATAFGCEVQYFSTSGKNNSDIYQKVDFEELLKTSDIISIHSALTEDTAGLFGYDEFEIMKKTAIIINTGRGGIINEKALANAIDENKIAGAGIDVFEKEPINLYNPLLNLKNQHKIILTPHIAFTSIEARSALVKGICNNIETWIFNEKTNFFN